MSTLTPFKCVVNVAPDCPARGQMFFYTIEPYEPGSAIEPVCGACFGFLCRREMERKENPR